MAGMNLKQSLLQTFDTISLHLWHGKKSTESSWDMIDQKINRSIEIKEICPHCGAHHSQVIIPGLHKESLKEAEKQIAMLCEMLKGTQLDLSCFSPKVGNPDVINISGTTWAACTWMHPKSSSVLFLRSRVIGAQHAIVNRQNLYSTHFSLRSPYCVSSTKLCTFTQFASLDCIDIKLHQLPLLYCQPPTL